MVQQIQKSQPIEMFQAELSKHFPPDKVDELLLHYNASIDAFRLNKDAECIVEAGKVAEAVLKGLHYRRTQEIVDKIKVEHEVIQLENATSLTEAERMTLPRTLRLIYEHRNKRGGAHNDGFDPNHMDASYVVSSLKWVLGELARLYMKADPDDAQRLVANLLLRDIPLVQDIDGSYVMLLPDLPARVQLEIFLYLHHPNRCQMQDLVKWIRRDHTEANIKVTLSNLRKKALVHDNQDGWRLTDSGLLEAMQEIQQITSATTTSKRRTVKTKGTRYGRKR